MKRESFNCPAEMTVHLIGGKWKVIVLWLLRKGPQRSGKIKSRLPGISPTAFSKAVRDLEQDGLIQRTAKGQRVIEVSYKLTSRGESLSPIVKTLWKWGLSHQQDYLDGEFGMEVFYKK